MYTRSLRLMPLIVCLACALPAHAARQPDSQLAPLPDLKVVNLKMADMPAEPSHFAVRTEWNDATSYAREYHRPAATLAREGFVAVSDADFRRATPTGSGVVEVSSEVAALSSAANARTEFSGTLKKALHALGVTFTPLALATVGDRSATFTATLRDKAYRLPLTEEALFFYRGTYTVIVVLIGGANTFPDHQILTLARLVDARIMAQIAHPISLLGGWNARAADFGTGFHLVSRAATATASTVIYRKSVGRHTDTGDATIRGYISAQAAQAVARATVKQLRSQGYMQATLSDANGQAGAIMTRTLTAPGGQKATTTEQVFAEDGFLVIDRYTDPDLYNSGFTASLVGTNIDERIIAYRVK